MYNTELVTQMKQAHTSGYMPPNRKINELSYKQAISVLNKHFIMRCAPNSQCDSEQLVESLVYLTVEKTYAESGLQNLACTHKAPSADTLLGRVKDLGWRNAYRMLVEANDQIIKKLKRNGVFKKPVMAAVDLSVTVGTENSTTRYAEVHAIMEQTSSTGTLHCTWCKLANA